MRVGQTGLPKLARHDCGAVGSHHPPSSPDSHIHSKFPLPCVVKALYLEGGHSVLTGGRYRGWDET
eukprot:1345971-Amorphochlora_amoeboformis.AAC.3